MNDDEFGCFLDEATEELRQKQDSLTTQHGFGSYSRWWFEQETQVLQFFDERDALRLEADIIDIGSFSPQSNTWLWAWANVSVLPALREKSGKIKELEAVTGYALFGDANTFEADGPMAWELAALAVKHLGAMGCYRAPSSTGGPHSFLAIMSVRRVQ
jgi:hypothetical protein